MRTPQRAQGDQAPPEPPTVGSSGCGLVPGQTVSFAWVAAACFLSLVHVIFSALCQLSLGLGRMRACPGKLVGTLARQTAQRVHQGAGRPAEKLFPWLHLFISVLRDCYLYFNPPGTVVNLWIKRVGVFAALKVRNNP